MSTIDITVDAGEFADMAALRGLDAAQFADAARRAVRTTVRQLQRLGLSRLAQSIGSSVNELAKRRRRVTGIVDNGTGEGRVWFGLEPVSASALNSAPSYSFVGPRGTRWARAKRISRPFVGRARGFKDRGGSTDTILKLFREIQSEGMDAVDAVSDRADELLRKNIAREIDQAIRRATYAQ